MGDDQEKPGREGITPVSSMGRTAKGSPSIRNWSRPGNMSGGAGRGSRRTGKGPVFRFVLFFALLMGLFHLALSSRIAREVVFPQYLHFNARVSGALLRLAGDPVSIIDRTIQGRFALTIERGCDALEPSALFLSGVLAFPSPWLRKFPGMLVGTVVLMLLNFVRVVSLYYVGVYWPAYFQFAHVSFWQAIFIFIAILFWVIWAVWAIRPAEKKVHVVAAGG